MPLKLRNKNYYVTQQRITRELSISERILRDNFSIMELVSPRPLLRCREMSLRAKSCREQAQQKCRFAIGS
jgi:hypothetical protein